MAVSTVNKEETELPEILDGELATVLAVKPVAKKTKPPKYYTEGTLLDDMCAASKFVEDSPDLKKALKVASGLGTSATRDSIIEGLKQDKYLGLKGQTLRATDKGIALIKWLEQVAPELTSVEQTARLEAELAIVTEKGGGDKFESQILKKVQGLVATLKEAPPMDNAQSLSTTYGKPPMTSSSTNPPTAKMLEFAQNIAKRLHQELSPDVSASFDKCKEYIDANKDASNAPSDKQIAFAERIAKDKGITLPENVRANRIEISKWIDANKS